MFRATPMVIVFVFTVPPAGIRMGTLATGAPAMSTRMRMPSMAAFVLFCRE